MESPPPSIPNSRHADSSSAHHRPLQTPSPAISDSNPSSCNPMQSWLESIARARSRIRTLAALLPPSPSAATLDAVADSDRPARSLLSFGDGYSAVSAALAGPSSGAGDDPLCRWLYETYQSPDPNLRLFVLSFVPLVAGIYLSRIAGAGAACSLAGFEAVLLSLYAAEAKARGGEPLLFRVPDLSAPSLYSKPSPPSSSAIGGGRSPEGPAAAPPQPTVRILSPPLEPQIAVKATVRASIAAVALDCYFKKISLMPSPSKLDLCEFAASWADQRRSFPNYLDQLDRSSNTRPGSSLFKGEEDETRGCEEEMGRSEIEDGDDGGGSGGLWVPLTGELLQPLLRILGHCLLAPANPPEVRDAASVAVRCVYARASRDLIPQAILASRSLIQLDDRARKAASMAMATRVRT
ncbi:unnamed protein product [Spirodela intermedia]|uniref:Uncharacterized protein n=1 Tax=Spirodela intermedia TaxID=51605 RepID=A0A7I8KW26_SPIIN|nr:unnamed protein product [Spirodela intermedia]